MLVDFAMCPWAGAKAELRSPGASFPLPRCATSHKLDIQKYKGRVTAQSVRMSAFDPKRTLEGLESRLLGNLAYDAILALVSRVSTRRELRRERVRSRCCLKTKNRSESRIGTTLAARSISSKSFSKASALWTETSRWSASSTSRNRR